MMHQRKNMCYEWENPTDFLIFKILDFTQREEVKRWPFKYLYLSFEEPTDFLIFETWNSTQREEIGPYLTFHRELFEQRLTKHVPANICPNSINSSAHYACILRELGETTQMCSNLDPLSLWFTSIEIHKHKNILWAIILFAILIRISKYAYNKFVTISEDIKNPRNVNEIEIDNEDNEEREVIIYKSEQLLQSSRTFLKFPWSRLSIWMRPILRPYTHWQIHAHFVELNRSYTFELRRGDGDLNHTDRSEGMPPPSRCVKLGDCKISSKRLVEIARSHEFNGQMYNVIDRNCQLWCKEFCSKIPGLKKKSMWDLYTVLKNFFLSPVFLVIIRRFNSSIIHFMIDRPTLPRLDSSMLLDYECLTMVEPLLGATVQNEIVEDKWLNDIFFFCLYVYSLLGFVVNAKILCFHNIASSVGSGVIIFGYFYWSFSVSLLSFSIIVLSFCITCLEIFYVWMDDDKDDIFRVDYYDTYLSVHVGYSLNAYYMFYVLMLASYIPFINFCRSDLPIPLGRLLLSKTVCCNLFSKFMGGSSSWSEGGRLVTWVKKDQI